MNDSALRRDISRLIGIEREKAGASLEALAQRAGISTAMLSRIEKGSHAPSLDAIEKIFTALGLQLRLAAEPLDDLDAQLDRASWRPVADRLEQSGLGRLLSTMGNFPYVIDGALAANLHGVPIPIRALEIAVAWADADQFTRWLVRRLAYRWHEQRQEFRMLDLDPRAPGPHRWTTGFGEIYARMCDELPDSIEVKLEAAAHRVRPLDQVQPLDPHAERLLQRYRERASD
jgi:transcriptional regulator with XRE-family HTH domain